MSLLEQEIESSPPEPLHIEELKERWGEKSGFSSLDILIIWEQAEKHYSALPYHHFQHAKETLWDAMQLTDECEANEQTVNRRALIVAALFHDANYHKPLPKKYETKEVYSAAILGRYVERFDLSPDDLFVAQNAIIATTRGSKTHSLEDKILRRADLANIAGLYAEDFLYKTRLHHQEVEMLTGKKINIWDFALDSIKILSDYLDDDLILGAWDKASDRMSVFQFKAIANLKSLATEIAKKRSEHVIDVLGQVSVTALKIVGVKRN